MMASANERADPVFGRELAHELGRLLLFGRGGDEIVLDPASKRGVLDQRRRRIAHAFRQIGGGRARRKRASSSRTRGPARPPSPKNSDAIRLSRGMPRPLAYIQPRLNCASASPEPRRLAVERGGARGHRAARLRRARGRARRVRSAAMRSAVSSSTSACAGRDASERAPRARRCRRGQCRARVTRQRRVGERHHVAPANRPSGAGVDAVMREVPRNRRADPVGQAMRRRVAQQPSRLADVGLRMPDVAGPEVGDAPGHAPPRAAARDATASRSSSNRRLSDVRSSTATL